jgi:tRNA(fMet)-specific endonuclease VapC
MKVVLDTNVCIDLLRGRARGRRLPRAADCRLSTVVTAELWVGAEKSAHPAAQREAVRTFIDLFRRVSFDDEAARHYGDIRAHLESQDTPIGPLDLLIAAHARSLGATLLTANLGEFRRVPGLKCAAWEEPRPAENSVSGWRPQLPRKRELPWSPSSRPRRRFARREAEGPKDAAHQVTLEDAGVFRGVFSAGFVGEFRIPNVFAVAERGVEDATFLERPAPRDRKMPGGGATGLDVLGVQHEPL